MLKCQSCQTPLLIDVNTRPTAAAQHDLEASFTFPHVPNQIKSRYNTVTSEIDDAYIVIDEALADDTTIINEPIPEEIRTDLPISATDLHIEVTSRLVQAASDLTQTDHPVCARCCADILERIEAERIRLEGEYQDYCVLLCQVQDAHPTATALIAANQPLTQQPPLQTDPYFTSVCKSIEEEESLLEKELNELLLERAAVDRERQDLEEAEKTTLQCEEHFWHVWQDLQSGVLDLSSERFLCCETHESALHTLASLSHISPLHDLFCIAFEGHIATIAGFRLGRLPESPTDWSEVSAALGQVALLVDTLKKRFGIRHFQAAKLHPMGPHSTVIVTKNGRDEVLELSKQDTLLTDFFKTQNFDEALVALLGCVQELCDRAIELNTERMQERYPINGHLIGNHSIKYQVSQESSWTRALKYLLFNLQLLILGAVQRGS